MGLLGAEGLVAFALFVFWIWALFDCISTDAASCRSLPKGLWLILVLLLPDIGALAWLFLGRPARAGWRPGTTDDYARSGPPGREDHPQPRPTPTIGITDRRSAELDRRLEEWERERDLRRRQDGLEKGGR